MSVRHTYTLNIIKVYINKRILPLGLIKKNVVKFRDSFLYQLLQQLGNVCSRSAVTICRSKQAQDRQIFKNQMVIDICRVVLTFTINDDFFHHKFFCDILVFHVYFRLNLIIYNINNTFFFMPKITLFTYNFFFISVTIQKLLNNYNYVQQIIWGKQ